MKYKLFLIMLPFCLISSCDDIIVKDISNEKIVVNCPADGFSATSSGEILFWWENIEGAESYDLQIVKPDFVNIMQLNLDLSLDTNKYIITLPEGNYQWRIRANNSSYSTQFFIRNLTIISEKK